MNKRINKFLSLIMSLIVLLSLIPVFTATVLAVETMVLSGLLL